MDVSVLQDWNTHWGGAPVSQLVLRHPSARAAVDHMVRELLEPPDAQWSLRPGPRQIGKTTSLGHVTSRLLDAGIAPRRIVIAALDQADLRRATDGDLQTLIEAALSSHAAVADEPLFLLLDEIQELQDWDAQLKTAWDRYHDRVRVTATGSSAFRLAKTTGASLTGRVRITRMFPMKFREVVESHPARERFIDGSAWTALQRLSLAARQSILGPKPGIPRALMELRSWIAARRELDNFLRNVFVEYCIWGGYPAVRPGGTRTGVQRLEFFEAAWGSMAARDLPHSGIRDVTGFGRLFRAIGENTGGKFVPANAAKVLDIKQDTASAWKKNLEELLVVQQLQPLKPNLRPDRGRDKAYLQDPGWFAYWRNVVDDTKLVGRPEMGALVETVVHDHLRRLRYNLLHATTGAYGYVNKPEIDACMQLGPRWLLVEVKRGGDAGGRLRGVGGPDDVRLVLTDIVTDLSGPDPWSLPAYVFALMC